MENTKTKNYNCDQCRKEGINIEETQEHLMKCPTDIKENENKYITYSEILNGNIKEQHFIAKKIAKNFEEKENIKVTNEKSIKHS